MNRLHRDWLTRNRSKLKDILPLEVADFLYQEECLSLDDLQRIMKAPIPNDQINILLEKLPEQNSRALHLLKAALKVTSPQILEGLGPIPAVSQETKSSQAITEINNRTFMRLTKYQEVVRDWIHVGKALELTEMDIMLINKGTDTREMAHQMLVKWKSKFGRKATPIVLISALRECDLNAVADDLEGI